ncbi:hypothetical protein BDR03DRAFT_429741 [Suillus americanus]|nr:hypothetical protein BDR03DRAFT_429741 [Suillus americanus]
MANLMSCRRRAVPRCSVISDVSSGFSYLVDLLQALGGGRQTTSINWQGRTKSDKHPYLAMTRSYNPHLPLFPGGHGVVFCEVKYFNDRSLITEPIDLIASDKPNKWVYLGSCETSRWGEISPHQLDLLQPRR